MSVHMFIHLFDIDKFEGAQGYAKGGDPLPIALLGSLTSSSSFHCIYGAIIPSIQYLLLTALAIDQTASGIGQQTGNASSL